MKWLSVCRSRCVDDDSPPHLYIFLVHRVTFDCLCCVSLSSGLSAVVDIFNCDEYEHYKDLELEPHSNRVKVSVNFHIIRS